MSMESIPDYKAIRAKFFNVPSAGGFAAKPRKVEVAPPPVPEPIEEVIAAVEEVEPIVDAIVEPVDVPFKPPAYVNDVLAFIVKRFGITLLDMTSERRTANLVKPRQIAMWLAKDITKRSLPYIGTRMGGRDHTTILHGIRKIERLRECDPTMREETDQIKADFLASRS